MNSLLVLLRFLCLKSDEAFNVLWRIKKIKNFIVEIQVINNK